MNSRPEVTRLLTLAACVWLERRGGAVYTEAQLHGEDRGLRLDVVHLGPQRAPASTGVEVKSCRADFAGDAKLQLYIGRVSQLYVATLPGVLRPDELPGGVGLLELNQGWTAVPEAPPLLPALRHEPSGHAQWRFELSLADHFAEHDVFRVVREAAPVDVPVVHELDLLRGLAVSGKKLPQGWKAQREHETSLEQLLWLNKDKERVA